MSKDRRQTAPFQAGNGRMFAVRIVREGDRYGRNDCLVAGAEKFVSGPSRVDEWGPLVEFWDTTHAGREGFDPALGQFVSRYYWRTLNEKTWGDLRESGLCLDGGNADAWSIDAATMRRIMDWVAWAVGERVDFALDAARDAIAFSERRKAAAPDSAIAAECARGAEAAANRCLFHALYDAAIAQ